MAYRRVLTTRVRLLTQPRFSPSFVFTHHEDDCENQIDQIDDSKIGSRSFSSFTSPSFAQLGPQFGDRRCYPFVSPMMSELFKGKHMSTAIVPDGSDKIEYMADVAEVLADKTVEVVTSLAPAASEVAIAAADSWFPVAALQYIIDGVHNFTGLNWWASIAVTTLLIRALTLPLAIYQLKATSKLHSMGPRLEEIKKMQNGGTSPSAAAEHQELILELFRNNVRVFTPLLIQGPIFVSFFLAIQNMVEKVPSFKEGGAYWFTDLTTPDSLYVLPVLTALTFWIVVECNMQGGMEGNSTANIVKNVSRVFAALTVPLTLSFPKAIFCYWITANVYSLAYGLVIKNHTVKKFLNIPIIVPRPPNAGDSSKPANQTSHPSSAVSSQATEVKKPASQRVSSSSVLSRRIKTLEKEAKRRKRGKKK